MDVLRGWTVVEKGQRVKIVQLQKGQIVGGMTAREGGRVQ